MWFLEKTPNSYIKFLCVLVLALCTFQTVRADETACVRDREGFRNLLQGREFPGEWIETSANDGKPLVIRMSSTQEQLYFVFDKTREGVWAEGLISICPEKNELVVKIAAEDIKLSKSTPTLVRWAMKKGATFRLKMKSETEMQVSTSGWKGNFRVVPQPVIETPAEEILEPMIIDPVLLSEPLMHLPQIHMDPM